MMRPVTLPGMLAASAAAHPDRVAVRDVTGAWTFAQVHAAVRALATRLRAQGVGPGDLVALVAARRAAAPVAMAAVMAAGAAYVPIDPAWPPARQRRIVDDCHPASILAVDTDTPLSQWSDTVRLRTADLGGHAPERVDDQGAHADGDAVAYVIFTSGSSGRPKGVVVTGRSAANVVSSVAELVGLDARSRLVALSSFSFDISVFEIFGTWCTGAELVLADEEQINPHRLAELLASGRTTYLQTTPSVLTALLDSGLALPDHTVLLLAGERLPRLLVRRVSHVQQVWNLYGPTETTIYAAAHACLPLPSDNPEPGLPIGRPVAGASLEIHRTGQADEGAGELVIGGPGVARGYLGQPELSARVFEPTPAGHRYRTGDLVQRNPDGTLTFLGRADRQVKIRGNRVELDEIEAVVSRIVGHTSLAVEVVEDSRLGTQIAAYVKAASRDDLAGLRERIAEVLPAYMVPTRIHRIERTPMTSSGKIDRTALTGTRPSGVDADEVQDWLADLWRDVLGTDVTAESNFYSLGGQSLVAMRITAAIEDKYGIAVGTGTVLRLPKLADLAGEIVTRLRTES